MSFGEGSLLKKLGLGVLTFTGMIVVLFASTILISAFSSAPDYRVADAHKLEINRMPSSLAAGISATDHLDRADSSVEIVTLDCLKDGVHVTMVSLAKQIRLKGRLCGGRNADLNKSSIVNRANGFAATLFNLENGNFTSDYISLEEGQNQIMFEMEDKAGLRAVTEVTISRSL